MGSYLALIPLYEFIEPRSLEIARVFDVVAHEVAEGLEVELGNFFLQSSEETSGVYGYLLPIVAQADMPDGASRGVEEFLARLLLREDTRGHRWLGGWTGLHAFYFSVPPGSRAASPVGCLTRDRTTDEVRRSLMPPEALAVERLVSFVDELRDVNDTPGRGSLPNEYDPIPPGSSEFDIELTYRGPREAALELAAAWDMISIDLAAEECGATWVGGGASDDGSSVDGKGTMTFSVVRHIGGVPDPADAARSPALETLIASLISKDRLPLTGLDAHVYGVLISDLDEDTGEGTVSSVLFVRDPITSEALTVAVPTGDARLIGAAAEGWGSATWREVRESGRCP